MRPEAALSCIALVLLAASLSPADAAGPEVTAGLTSDSGVQLVSGSALGGRRLLRKTGKDIKIDWSPKGYWPLTVPAGTIVVFKYRRGCGLGYGARRCSYTGTFDKNSRGGGQISVKIPRGSTWFSDPSSNNCQRGATILITGI